MPKINRNDLESALGNIDDDLLDGVINEKLRIRERHINRKTKRARFRAPLIAAAVILIAAAVLIPVIVFMNKTPEPAPANPTTESSAEEQATLTPTASQTVTQTPVTPTPTETPVTPTPAKTPVTPTPTETPVTPTQTETPTTPTPTETPVTPTPTETPVTTIPTETPVTPTPTETPATPTETPIWNTDITTPTTPTPGSEYCVFSRNKDNSLTLVDLVNYPDEVEIPSTHKGLPVTAISPKVFYDKPIVSMFIPKTVVDVNLKDLGDPYFEYLENQIGSIEVEEGNPVYHSAGNCLIKTKDKILVLGCKNSVIPDDGSVEVIGEYAFSRCKLEKVVIPESVTVIEKYALAACRELTSLTLPKIMTRIDKGAFDACISLTRIDLPEGLDELSDRLFDNCMKLREISIPEGVRKIGDRTFYSCREMKELHIPASLVEIYVLSDDSKARSFSELASLETITVAEGNPRYAAIGSCLVDKDTRTVILGSSGADFEALRGQVETIGQFAFEELQGLTTVELPEGILCVDVGTFAGSSVEVCILPDSLTTFGYYSFARCRCLKRIVFGKNVERVDWASLYNCSALESIEVREGNARYISVSNCLIDVTQDLLVIGCKNSVIPDDGSVKIIGDCAFLSRKGMGKLVVPEGVETIGDSAFYDCCLYEIDLPSTIKWIDRFVFDAQVPYAVDKLVIRFTDAQCVYNLCFGDTPRFSNLYFVGNEEQWAAFREKFGTLFDQTTVHLNSAGDETEN